MTYHFDVGVPNRFTQPQSKLLGNIVPGRENRPRWVLLEQISVCACAHKHDQAVFCAVIKSVSQ
jgi:hypothetical protein